MAGHITGINRVRARTTGSPSTWVSVSDRVGAWISEPFNVLEQGVDMVMAADGNLALAVLVNTTGDLSNNIGNSSGAKELLSDGTLDTFALKHEYRDGDAFLLKINKANIGSTSTSSLLTAKNVGHFSGSNWTLSLAQDIHGQFIIGGSSNDLYGTYNSMSGTYSASSNMNLKDPWIGFHPGYGEGSVWNAYVVGTNDDTNPDVWRRTFSAEDLRAGNPYSGGNGEHEVCLFDLTTTADGGFVICGNNEINTDDYTVTKFAPVHQGLMVSGIGGSYTKFGNADIPVEYRLSANETWPNTNVPTGSNIASKVVVPNGKKLTINGGTYHFASSDHLWDYMDAPSNYTGGTLGCGIVVEPGGKLEIINNALLTGLNTTGEHNMWDGIVVQGNPGSPGAPAAKAAQGNATLTECTIEDARYGLYVSDNYRTYTTVHRSAGLQNGETYGTRYNGYATVGGGVVTASSVHFKNCRFGINFQNSPYNNNSSTIKYCDFNSDATGMGDICYYTDETGGLLPANTHVAAWNIRTAIAMHSNTLTCVPAFRTAVRPVGIISNSANMAIAHRCNAIFGNPCVSIADPGNRFTNLGHGIVVANAPGIVWPMTITDNYFDNNGSCIEAASMVNALTITDNEMHINGNYLFTPDPNMYAHPTGITLAGCKGYAVTENTFDQCASCSGFTSFLNSRGIVVNNGDVQNEIIEHNTFNQINYANIACQTNGILDVSSLPFEKKGLQFHCNVFNNSYVDITRSSTWENDGTIVDGTVNPEQGACLGLATPAGNQFNNPCVSGGGHLMVEDGFVSQTVTYNNNNAGSIYDPGICFDGSSYVNTGCPGIGTPTAATACPPPPEYLVVNVVKWLADLASVEIAIRNTQDLEALQGLKYKRCLLVNQTVHYYTMKQEYLAAAMLLHTYERYEDALPQYLAAGKPLMAQLMHYKMPKKTEEQKLYAKETEIAILLNLCGKTWMDLDDEEVREHLDKIEQLNSPAGYMAGSLGMLIGAGTVNWPVPAMDTTRIIDTTSRTSGGAGSGNTDNNISANPISDMSNNSGITAFSIYPNPTLGNFTISATSAGKFVLYTLVGQKIEEYKVNAGQTDLSLPATLATGMYMGMFKPADGSKSKEVKIVYER